MASFIDLKASRSSRQRPLPPVTSPSLVDTRKSDPLPPKTKSTEPEPEPASNNLTLQLTTLKPHSTNGSIHPLYPDFPVSKIQVLPTPTAGRGILLLPQVKIGKGESIIQTNPLCGTLSTGELGKRCNTCFLDERELAIVSGKMGEWEQRVGRGLRDDTSTRETNMVGEKGEEGGLKRCMGCKVVRYCSKKCQKSDWTSHSPECKSLQRIRLLIRSRPPVSTSSIDLISQREKELLQAVDPSAPLPPSSAEDVNGEEERKGLWIPPEEIRALGRICWDRRRAIGKGKDEGERFWKPIAALQSHRAKLQTKQREPYAKLALKLNQYLSCGEPLKKGQKEGELVPVDMSLFGFTGVPEVLDLCTAFASNSFTLSSSSLEPIGVAISPLVALFNHSCVPNAVVVFPNGGMANDQRGMEVVALRDLEQGEEILTSYVDVASPYHIRHKELLETYHFDCACPSCVRSKAGEVMPQWALRHPACGQAVGIPDMNTIGSVSVKCEPCGVSYQIDMNRFKSLVEFAEQLLQEDAHGLLGEFHASKIPSITDALSEYLLPSSYPFQQLLRLRSLLSSQPTPTLPDQPVAETVVNLFDAVEAQALAWKGMKAVYPEGHPSLGIALTELGKLLNLDAAESTSGEAVSSGVNRSAVIPAQAADRLGLARETLIMALKELRIGFGKTGGLVGKEVEGILEGLVKEMQFKGLTV